MSSQQFAREGRSVENSGWHIEDIKAALRKKYGSLRALAVSWGYDANTLSGVLRKPIQSPPMELRVAEALGVAAHELWPDRWHPDGTPKPRVAPMRRPRRLLPASQKPSPDSQKRGAA